MFRPVTLVAVALLAAACGDDESSISATLQSPSEGSTVAGALHVAMTADGVTIEEAGTARDGAGHFHVIVDDGCAATGQAVPKDADHVHFGKGQAEGDVYLAPGRHELCLQVADGAHRAMDVTDTATVTAGITDRDEWCTVVREVDELFTAADTNGDEFPVRRIAYENVRRLLLQLRDAVDTVDADVRADVAAALAVGTDIAKAYVDAADEDEAYEHFQEIARSGDAAIETAAPWIEETCGVAING
jgi:hypothetical protein